jgi:hypothetical protein
VSQQILITEPFNYHSNDRGGYFALCHHDAERWRQEWYELILLPEVLKYVNPRLDTYLSQAEFFRRNRRLVNLARIGLCFAEIDYYNVPDYRWHEPQKMAFLIIDYCQREGILLPSLIISSGRGLHLKWILEAPIPMQALPRWGAVQKYLSERFRQFGADMNGIDGSRVLRLEHTVNTKTGEVCKVIWTNFGDNIEPARYDFELLMHEVLPFTREELQYLKAQRQKRRERAAVEGKLPNTIGLQGRSERQLNWDRLDDLRTLARLRNQADGIHEGMRDTFLFLATCFAAWAVDPTLLYQEILQLAAEFVPSLSRREILGYTSAAYGRAKDTINSGIETRYKFKNQTLIDRLQITREEERSLKTIIGMEEALERDRQRKRASYRQDKPDAIERGEYLLQASNRREQAIVLAGKGKSIPEIARELGVSIHTIKNYLYR